MAKKLKNNGFSLTEVLMAVGILSIGMMLVATMFPAAIYLTTVASERTMAAIVADEAFAKIQLFGIKPPPSSSGMRDYNDISISSFDPIEFSYPPVDPCTSNRQYYWSALCKPLDPNEYLVTVFVARKTNPNHTYYHGGDNGDRPKAILVDVNVPADQNELQLSTANARYVNPPTTILDNKTCKIYRVIERKIAEPNVVLDRVWEGGTGSASIWLVPPPESGGKNADIEVFQRIIRF